ncbi:MULTISPECIES: GNAT family N-acetyltransferase [Enterococcus]|uniref:N-acetyltransferase domain-containing protein n=1 Tax=Candidatus Enterococcus mangumiae TaxID=2230878 RepID=A0ABZ2SS62_9ENTE|nr:MULTISPECIES: N-acetyltransferase [unclassified Enterococcus]MBO0460704.1 GNAT family N-acetyltransferase [Enterococcus sp. DIV1298c]MBO0488825.1 GNAT family N-acetyltransferase [Enterococcus sp. DIV1094]MBO1298869.1 GNAT family N-acetyltransferase [Enterococcus sp. DIV1271a]
MFEQLNKNDLPWALLLEADPDKDKVMAYVTNGDGFIWKEQDEVIGVLVYEIRDTEFEIMNVSVADAHQGKGIGGKLLDHAIERLSKESGQQTKILIRTGSITNPALHLYQKKGFEEVSREKDYFINNYPEPIYEEGILLRDQVTLAKKL